VRLLQRFAARSGKKERNKKARKQEKTNASGLSGRVFWQHFLMHVSQFFIIHESFIKPTNPCDKSLLKYY